MFRIIVGIVTVVIAIWCAKKSGDSPDPAGWGIAILLAITIIIYCLGPILR